MLNKKLILLVSLFLLVGVVFVSASMNVLNENNEAKQYAVEIQVEKGWNLIASGFTFAPELRYLDETGDIKYDNIKAVYVYSNKLNSYFESYPNYDSKLYSAKDFFSGDEQDIVGQANWIYVDKSGILKYQTKAIKNSNERNLFSGWNFVSITPEMFYEKDGQDVFSWIGIKGDCSFEKIYGWNPEGQDWMQISADSESFDFNDFIGMGMIVKVRNDCKLGKVQGAVPTIPTIPN